jgi:hypothetical protein
MSKISEYFKYNFEIVVFLKELAKEKLRVLDFLTAKGSLTNEEKCEIENYKFTIVLTNSIINFIENEEE